MRKKIIMVVLFIFLLTGCFFDPYTNNKYGEMVVDSWYSYKNGEDDLGKVRREVEDIYSIEDRTCEYVTKYKSNYIFNCTIKYKEISETIIPFSNPKELKVYALFTPKGDDTFTYKIYNSSSEEGIWEKDSSLK